MSLERLEVVAVDEVDAVLCDPNEFNATVPDMAQTLLDMLLLLRAPDDDKGPLVVARPQFIITTAHLSRAHDTLLADLFPTAVSVRQMNARGGAAKGVLVPTLRQAFHYFTGDDASKFQKLRDVVRRAGVRV